MARKRWYMGLDVSGSELVKSVDGWPVVSLSKVDPLSGDLTYNFLTDVKINIPALDQYYSGDINTFIDNDETWLRIKNSIDGDDLDLHIALFNYVYHRQFTPDDIVVLSYENEDIYRYSQYQTEESIFRSMQYLFLPLHFTNAGQTGIKTYQKSHKLYKDYLKNDIGIEENGGPLGREDVARPRKESYVCYNGEEITRRIVNSYNGVIYTDTPIASPYGSSLLIETNDNLGQVGKSVSPEDHLIYKIVKNSQDDNGAIVVTPTFSEREWTDYASVYPGRVYPLGDITNLTIPTEVSGVDTDNAYIYPRQYNQEYTLRSRGSYEAYCEKESDFGYVDPADVTEHYGYFRHVQCIGSLPPEGEGDKGRYKAWTAEGDASGYRVGRSKVFSSHIIAEVIKTAQIGSLSEWYFPDVNYWSRERETDKANVQIHEPSYVSANYGTVSGGSAEGGSLRAPVGVYRLERRYGVSEFGIDGGDLDPEISAAGVANPRKYYYVGDLPLKLEPGQYSFVAEGPQVYLNRNQYPLAVGEGSGYDQDYSGQLSQSQNIVKEFTITISPIAGVIPTYQKILHTGKSDIGGESSDHDDVVLTIAGNYLTTLSDTNYQIPANTTYRVDVYSLLQYRVSDGQRVGEDYIPHIFESEQGWPSHYISDPHLYYLSPGKVLLVYVYREDISAKNLAQEPYYGQYPQLSIPCGANYSVDQIVAKVLSWDTDHWTWDYETDSRFLIKSDVWTSTTGADVVTAETIVDRLQTQNKYRVTGISEMMNGNILLGIQHAEVRATELPNEVIRVDWYYGEDDWKEDPDTAGVTAIMHGYVQVVGEVDNLDAGDHIYIYVPPWRREGDIGAPIQGSYTYPIPHKITRIDYVEDSNSSFITVDPPPDRHQLGNQSPPSLSSKEQAIQYWKGDDEHDIIKEGDDTISYPCIWKISPQTEFRSELLEIGKNELNVVGTYQYLDIDTTYVPTESKEFTVSTEWDTEKQGYTTEVPTGRVVWEDSPDYELTDEFGVDVPSKVIRDEGSWTLYTSQPVENATLTIEVYPEGTIQPIGKMKVKRGEGETSYDAIYQNGKFYRWEGSELLKLYPDHTERVYQAGPLLTDPIENYLYTDSNNEIYKHFLALVGGRPRNICTPRLPVLRPDPGVVSEEASTLLALPKSFGYTTDFQHNITAFMNILWDETVYYIDSYIDLQEMPRNILGEDISIIWGEDEEYTTSTLMTVSSKKINTKLVNKSDALLRLIFEKVCRHNDLPAVKIKVDLEEVPMLNIKDGLGKRWLTRGRIRDIRQDEILVDPPTGNAYMLLVKYDLFPENSTTDLHFIYLPKEL